MKALISIFVAVALSGSSAFALGKPLPKHYKLGIEVFDTDVGGARVPTATAEIRGDVRRADASGVIPYRLVKGDYEIKINAEGYEPQQAQIQLQADQNQPFPSENSPTVRIALKRKAPSIHSFAVEVFGESLSIDKRLAGATVKVGTQTKTSDGNGFVQFSVSTGEQAIEVNAPGYEAHSERYLVDRDHMGVFPSDSSPTHRVVLAKKPAQSFNFVVEVFNGLPSASKRIPNALVKVGSDSRTSDGNGFTHFWKQSGRHEIEVSAKDFKTFSQSYVIDREHTGQYPSGELPSFRVSLETSLPPQPCTSPINNDGNAGLPKALPNMRSVVEKIDRENPGLLAKSCKEHGGNNEFLFAVVRELRKTDVRWGLNWKRGNIGDMSQDVVDYYFGQGPFEGQPSTYVVDIILGHCGNNPQPAWGDVTCYGSDGKPNGPGCPVNGARWTIEPMRKCQ